MDRAQRRSDDIPEGARARADEQSLASSVFFCESGSVEGRVNGEDFFYFIILLWWTRRRAGERASKQRGRWAVVVWEETYSRQKGEFG